MHNGDRFKPHLGAVRLRTRTGLDWTHKYPALAAAVSSARGAPGLSRRRRRERSAADRAEDTARRLAVERRTTTALQRLSQRRGGCPSTPPQLSLRGHCTASQCVSRPAIAPVAKVKCLNPEQFVVVGLDRFRRISALYRRLAPCLLRFRRPPGLCRPRRQRHQSGRTGAAAAPSAAACHGQNATGSAAATLQPFRIAPGL